MGLQTVQVALSRAAPNIPWGFRLHGGTDYGTPLIVQKVGHRDQVALLVEARLLMRGLGFESRVIQSVGTCSEFSRLG
jgi:hypothetical protein